MHIDREKILQMQYLQALFDSTNAGSEINQMNFVLMHELEKNELLV